MREATGRSPTAIRRLRRPATSTGLAADPCPSARSASHTSLISARLMPIFAQSAAHSNLTIRAPSSKSVRPTAPRVQTLNMARVSMAATAAAASAASSSSSLAEERRDRSYYGYQATASDLRLTDAAAQQPSQQLDAPEWSDFDLWESPPSNPPGGWAVDDHGQPMAAMLAASDPRMLMATNLPIQPASSPATSSFASGWVVRTPSTSNISGFENLRVPDRRSQSYGATDSRTLSTSDNISGTASDGSASLAGSPWASPQVPDQLYQDLMLPCMWINLS